MHDSYDEPVQTRWRFKRRKLSHDSEPEEPIHIEDKFNIASEPARKHRRHHHHHRRSKSHPTKSDHASQHTQPSEPDLDPDAAFRESLFDAMADDEGAAFWEGVYGQPIHIYPDAKEGPNGEAEKMTDEEYTSWVRHKMWEKTHEGILHEMEKQQHRTAAWQKRRDEKRKHEAERRQFNRQMEESLKRAEARKQTKKWQEAWIAYERAWERVNQQMSRQSSAKDSEDQTPQVEIPWPVMSGNMTDICKASVEAFLRQGPPRGKDGEVDLRAVLKVERVKFHPDKAQHRFGGQALGQERLKVVTTVFQIVDDMWAEVKKARA